ncbi:MAG TPA: biotin/lipoyl-containing protein [Acidimicrobiales bacterium]|nr:biotin/lipoyl-containing protein [Acidimicrobiales bacterium]
MKLPRLGDTTQTVLVAEWRCDVGTDVAVGTALLAVETDKVTTEVPSPVAGRLVEQLVHPDDEIDVGDPICVIES